MLVRGEETSNCNQAQRLVEQVRHPDFFMSAVRASATLLWEVHERRQRLTDREFPLGRVS